MRAAFLLALVGCLDPGTPQAPPEAPAPKVRRSEPSLDHLDHLEQPPPPKVDVSLGDGIEVRRPIKSGRLQLIPIIDRAQPRATKFITLQDGMDAHQVDVIDIIEIEKVQIRNKSETPLVIMGGELIVEAYQDRMVQHDTVVAPKTTMQVAVYCVERGRFEGNEWFRASHALGEPVLRRTAATGDQGAVWDRVDEINAREGLAPPTDTYRFSAARHRSQATTARGSELAKQLDSLEERDHVVGHAIAIDGKVVAIDRFATPALYRQLRPMVLASYLHVSQGAGKVIKDLGPADVQAFAKVNASSVIGASPRQSRNPPAAPPTDGLELQ